MFPGAGQPNTIKALVGGKNEKLKDLLPDSFAFGPNVMTNAPGGYIDLKLTLSATTKVPAHRKEKVLADAKKIAALEVGANTLAQQAQEVFQTYYGQNNAKGQQLIAPIFSELDMVMAQLDGSAKENLAPEVVPYEDALGTEVVSKMNGVGKWVDAFNGASGAAGEPLPTSRRRPRSTRSQMWRSRRSLVGWMCRRTRSWGGSRRRCLPTHYHEVGSRDVSHQFRRSPCLAAWVGGTPHLPCEFDQAFPSSRQSDPSHRDAARVSR